MITMKLRAAFLGILIISMSLISTGQDLDLAKLRKDIVAHSPEAEAMAKYGVLPVTLYTGIPQISVPIYEIKTPSLSLPFSLSYNYNGCKPSEIASWVGLGWAIQGGGVITRSVKGQVDESMSSGHHYDDFVNVSAMTWKQDFLKDVADGVYDTEGDLYIFNIAGYSGKFVMIKGQAYITPYQNLRITAYSTGFKLIDDKGNEYQLTDYETTYHKTLSGTVPIPTHKSAWYLSKVISADKRDTVFFSYAAYTYKQQDSYMDSYTIDGHLHSGNNTSGHTFTSVVYPGDHIDGLLMSSVTSKYGNIYFIPSDINRKDVTGSTNPKYLDGITISGPTGSSINRQLILKHGYFSDSSRLKLKEVLIKGYRASGDILDSNKYKFDYEYESNSFPTNGTRSIDFYGYYNGASNSMLFPSGSFSPALYSYADRTPNTSHIGMINKITYPTGGYSTFEYEQNQSGHYIVTSSYVDTTQSISGVTYNSGNQSGGFTKFYQNFSLLKSQFVKINFNGVPDDVVDTFPILKIFKSVTDQLLYEAPRRPNPNIPFTTDSILLDVGDYYFMVQCNQSIPSGTNGSVSYKKYVVDNTLANAPGLRIHKINSFAGMNSTDTASIKEYQYNEGVELTGGGVTGGNIHNTCSDYYVTTYQAACKSALSDLADEQFYYKEATEINRSAQKNGKTFHTYDTQTQYLFNVNPTSQIDYKYSNGNYIPVKKSVTQYYSNSPISFDNYKVKKTATIGAGSSCSLITSPDQTQPTIGLNDVYDYTDYSGFVSGYTVPTQENEILYNDWGDSVMQTQTNYYYDDTDHVYPTRIITKNSKGLTLTTTLKYPLDYTFDSCSTTLTSLNHDFVTGTSNAIGTLNTCLSGLVSALSPYQPFSPNTSGHQSSFTSLVNSYDCQTSFKNASATAFTNRDEAWSGYLSCLSSHVTSNPTPWKKAVIWMKQNNVVSPVIEKYITIKNPDSSEYLLSATRNEYAILSSQAVMPVGIKQVEANSSLLKSTFLSNPDTYYKPQVNFGYDSRLNLAVQNMNNNLKQSYLWDYANMYPVAEVIDADTSAIAYTSFEVDGKGNFSFTGATAYDLSSPTGKKDYNIANGNVTKSGLLSGTTYVITYWRKDGTGTPTVNSGSGTSLISKRGWTLYKHEISGSTTVTVSGTGYIDELRLYPKGALMTTYTYDPLTGMSGQCDPNNRINYYEYDGLGKLLYIRDQDKNIVKKFCYNLYGQAENCTLYGNVLKTGTYTKNNCGTDSIGSSVIDSVKANTFFATTQAEADSLAQNDINVNGQAYANAHGTCTYNMVTVTSDNYVAASRYVATYTNNSTSTQYQFTISSLSGTRTMGTIPAGTYTVNISKSGGTLGYIFGTYNNSCSFITSTGSSATFYNVVISNSSGCNGVSIDLP